QLFVYESSIYIRVMEKIANRAMRFFPKLDDMNIIRSYTGFRPFTEDHLPFVSGVDEVPGYYIAAGHEGDGIALATGTGKMMEEIVNEKSEKTLPVEPLRFDRFKK